MRKARHDLRRTELPAITIRCDWSDSARCERADLLLETLLPLVQREVHTPSLPSIPRRIQISPARSPRNLFAHLRVRLSRRMPDELDGEVFARFVQGDPEAFERLFRQFKRD